MPGLLRVDALGVELGADEAELLIGRGRGDGQVTGGLRLPGHRQMDLLEGGAGVEGVEAHLALVVEVIDAEVGHDDRRAAPEPALPRAALRRRLRPAEVAW